MGLWYINKQTKTVHEISCFILDRTKIHNIHSINTIENDAKVCKICKPDPNEYQSQVKELTDDDKRYISNFDDRRKPKD